MIGDLNKRIMLQSKVQTSDSMGGFVETWVDEAIISAAIWSVSANEQIQAMQMAMIITHRIRIRHQSVLKPSWRIKYSDKYGDKFYAIISIINPNMRNEYLDLICKEAL